MSRKYKIRDQEKLYFVTFPIIEWIDLFTRRVYRDILMDSLRYCQQNNQTYDASATFIFSLFQRLLTLSK